jgi:tRNA pseudouridine13 synthase
VARLLPVPEDFVVEEIPLYPPQDCGEHTLVYVEKRGLTTEEAARALARAAGVPARDVGIAGRKDRVAVARQWLSLPGLEPERALSLSVDGVAILAARRHPHKLRTGDLAANRFHITLSEVAPHELDRAEQALLRAQSLGMPNRFGPQRFGRDGRNAERGRAVLAGEARPRDRRAARFLVSALQAEVFNRVLARRELPLDAVEAGEVAFLHASGASFVVEDAARESERARRFELSASGPIFGTRLLLARGAAGARESQALRELGLPEPHALRPPPGLRLRGARRPLRVRPADARLEPLAGGRARLVCVLPSGSYASILLDELFGVSQVPHPGE